MSEIELILKSPTDRISPFSVKCNTSWTIKELKLHIKDVYPCKPTIESQKVIYVGKLLKDDQILKDIFESDSSTIVHFICQPSFNEDEKEIKENKMEITPERYPDLYKEYQSYISNFYLSSSQSFATMNHMQQMMWINHVYMQTYANYCAQFSSASQDNSTIQNVTGNTEVVSPPLSSETAPQNQENPPPNDDRRMQPAGENGMQNMMAAAFGGLMGDGGEDENDGEVEPRDILHYFYILVRFGLLLLICYYYSSVVSVITTLMLFFVFFGVNILRRNNHAAVPPVVVVLPAAQPPPAVVALSVHDDSPVVVPAARDIVDGGDDNVAVPDGDDNESTHPLAPTVVTTTVPDPIPTITERLKRAASTSLQFVFTFFVTLFPEPIAHIDIN